MSLLSDAAEKQGIAKILYFVHFKIILLKIFLPRNKIFQNRHQGTLKNIYFVLIDCETIETYNALDHFTSILQCSG